MTALTAAISAVVGLFTGSVLTMVVERVPVGDGLVGRPRCPACRAPVRLRDDLPVVSWLALGRRCRSCSRPISPRYPAVELVTAMVFVAVTLRLDRVTPGAAGTLGALAAVPAYWVFAAVLVVVSAIDLERSIIPNRVVYPALAAALPLLVVASAGDRSWSSLATAAIGGAAAFAFLLVVHLIQPAGMGFGDVRLAGVIGVYLGWLGLGQVAVGLVAGFLLAAVVGAALLLAGSAGRTTKVPFGPFMAGGAMVSLLWGVPIGHALVG